MDDGLDLCPAFEKHVWEIAQRRPLTCCANASFHQNSIAHCQRIIFPTCFRRDGHFLGSDSRLVDLLHALIIPHVLMTCRFRLRTRNLRHAQHSGRCTRYTPPTLRSTIAALSCSARDSFSSLAKAIDQRSRDPSISAPRRTDGPLANQPS